LFLNRSRSDIFYRKLVKVANQVGKIFKFFGKSPNSAIVVAVGIAAFKGIFRPLYTLHDKKSDPQTKKYTAWREGLTEGIAIPVYIAIPFIANKLFVEKKYKTAPENVKKAAATNVKFIGVLLATAVIPAVCNLIQPPIMASIKKRAEAKKALLANNPLPAQDKPNQPSLKGAYPLAMRKSYNNGMRVGS